MKNNFIAQWRRRTEKLAAWSSHTDTQQKNSLLFSCSIYIHLKVMGAFSKPLFWDANKVELIMLATAPGIALIEMCTLMQQF